MRKHKSEFALFDFAGQVPSKILVTPDEGDIAEAESTSEKQSLVVTTENHAISCFTKTPTGNDKETCSSENNQQEASLDKSASKISSFKKVLSSSLDSGNDRSGVYEERKSISEDKQLTAGAKDQANESTKIARCKLPFENNTTFIGILYIL